jgi:hypothetical protein
MLSTVCSAPLTTDAAVLAAFAMSVAVWARPVVAVGIAGKGQRQKNGRCEDKYLVGPQVLLWQQQPFRAIAGV